MKEDHGKRKNISHSQGLWLKVLEKQNRDLEKRNTKKARVYSENYFEYLWERQKGKVNFIWRNTAPTDTGEIWKGKNENGALNISKEIVTEQFVNRRTWVPIQNQWIFEELKQLISVIWALQTHQTWCGWVRCAVIIKLQSSTSFVPSEKNKFSYIL